MIDYEIQRSRGTAPSPGASCAGETFYSTLTAEGPHVVRRDYASEAWQGAPEGVLGWWKSQVPEPSSKKLHWAPNDVMLDLLEALETQSERHDLRYVLALLLIRRRVVRLEETERDEAGRETLQLYCPRRETTYRVVVAAPSEERTAAIQEELAGLLFAGSD